MHKVKNINCDGTEIELEVKNNGETFSKLFNKMNSNYDSIYNLEGLNFGSNNYINNHRFPLRIIRERVKKFGCSDGLSILYIPNIFQYNDSLNNSSILQSNGDNPSPG